MISCADSGALTFGGIIAMQNLINGASPYPGVMSISYGVCEARYRRRTATWVSITPISRRLPQGISVFVSSGDDGSSGCGDDFSTSGYTVAGLGITGWGETPYNVSVGGTDFEDVYNQKTNANGGAALSTYWNTTLPTASPYGSAKSYVPEMPWDDSCANALISEVTTGSYTGYGASRHLQQQHLRYHHHLSEHRRRSGRPQQLRYRIRGHRSGFLFIRPQSARAGRSRRGSQVPRYRAASRLRAADRRRARYS